MRISTWLFGLSVGAVGCRIGELADSTVRSWPVGSSPAGFTDDAQEALVRRRLASLDLEQKVGQTIQADIGSIRPEDLTTWPVGSILVGGNGGPGGQERAPASAWAALAGRYQSAVVGDIPLLFGIDAVHGHNNVVGAVIFPHNIGLGATGEPALAARIADATAEAVVATGMNWTFAPTLAVPQDLRWGRTYEGFGGTPSLVASFAGPVVRGFQGDLVPGRALGAGKIAATAKHFIGDGGTRRGRDQGDTRVSEQELIDVHARSHIEAIEAGVLTVMASFSSWNGQKVHGSRYLLTDVLKGRLGFRGLVVGDWNAHGQLPGCTNARCPDAMNAGLDMYMVPADWKALFTNLVEDVRSGVIPMARLDDAVTRILRVKAKLGLLDGERPGVDLSRVGAADHRALAREAVRKSLVLLKNEGVLPLSKSARVLVVGRAADDIATACGGWTLSWHGDGNTNADFPNGQSIAAALAERVAATERSLDGTFSVRPDVAVVVFGEAPYAEGRGDERDLHFEAPEAQAALRQLEAAGIPTVSVFLSGRPREVDALIEASDAFVAAWLPGSEGGGVVDVLVGAADFRGRLPFAWPGAGGEVRFPLGFGLGRSPRR
jgi:beta-glucosidase